MVVWEWERGERELVLKFVEYEKKILEIDLMRKEKRKLFVKVCMLIWKEKFLLKEVRFLEGIVIFVDNDVI